MPHGSNRPSQQPPGMEIQLSKKNVCRTLLCHGLNPLDCRGSPQVPYSENLTLAETRPARTKGKEMAQREGRLLDLLGFCRQGKGPQIYLTGNMCCSSGKGANDPTEG